MNREYRFVLLDADMRPVDGITLVCPTDTDAMTVGGRFGSRRHVQVWDGDRFIGMVAATNPTRSAAAMATAVQPTPAPASVAAAPVPVEPAPTPPAPAPASVDLSTLKLEPVEEPPAFDPSRPYNPFRRGVWRKRTGE